MRMFWQLNIVMTDQDHIATNIKNDISAALYTYLAGMHSKLETDISTDLANEILLTVLSLNLGHIIGQLDPASRKHNLKLVNRLIKDQITEVSKLTDIEVYGHIGHA